MASAGVAIFSGCDVIAETRSQPERNHSHTMETGGGALYLVRRRGAALVFELFSALRCPPGRHARSKANLDAKNPLWQQNCPHCRHKAMYPSSVHQNGTWLHFLESRSTFYAVCTSLAAIFAPTLPPFVAFLS